MTAAQKMILFSGALVLVVPMGMNEVFADHASDISTWSTDRKFDIQSSLNNVSHASFTPDKDFEDSADV